MEDRENSTASVANVELVMQVNIKHRTNVQDSAGNYTTNVYQYVEDSSGTKERTVIPDTEDVGAIGEQWTAIQE